MQKELPIHLKYPDKFSQITTSVGDLRKISYQVKIDDEATIAESRALANKMYDLLVIDATAPLIRGNTIGYGLATRQLVELEGKETPRLSVVVFPSPKKGIEAVVYKMINPQIVHQERPFTYRGEGCLSFPHVYYNTKRFRCVKVGFVDLDSLEPREIAFIGTEAVVLQHEIDHHNGLLFIDRANIPFKAEKKIGPNEPCPCRSGKKFKKCCMK